MTTSQPWHDGWGDVDASADAIWFVRQLERRSAELLEQFGGAAGALGKMLRLRKGSRVVDVGCGIGDLLGLIAPLVGDRGRVCGVDRSVAMLMAARARHPAIEWVQAQGASLPFAAGTFDAAIASLVLEHVDNPSAVVREMARVVRPGGRILLRDTDWTSLEVNSDDDRIFTCILEEFSGSIKNPWIAPTLPDLLTRAGVIEVETILSEQIHQGSPPRELWTLLCETQARLGDPASAAWLREVEQRAWGGRWQSRSETWTACGTVAEAGRTP